MACPAAASCAPWGVPATTGRCSTSWGVGRGEPAVGRRRRRQRRMGRRAAGHVLGEAGYVLIGEDYPADTEGPARAGLSRPW